MVSVPGEVKDPTQGSEKKPVLDSQIQWSRSTISVRALHQLLPKTSCDNGVGAMSVLSRQIPGLYRTMLL